MTDARSLPKSRRVRLLWVAGLLGTALAVVPARAQEGEGGIPGGEMVRGVVQRVAGDTLTVKTETGETVAVVATNNTRILRERQTGKFADIKAGDGVGAAGILEPAKHLLHAAVIGVMDADEVRKAQAELGKSYIMGRLQVIDLDGLRLTIHRPDGVTQVIAVDEGTSFRRGGRSSGVPGGSGADASGQATPATAGDSITLADLRVGESVAGKGGLKSGVFVPTELHVFVPGSAHRRASEAGAGGSPAPGGTHP